MRTGGARPHGALPRAGQLLAAAGTASRGARRGAPPVLVAHHYRRRGRPELSPALITIYQEAARIDPDIAADLPAIMGNRERAFRRLAEALVHQLLGGWIREPTGATARPAPVVAGSGRKSAALVRNRSTQKATTAASGAAVRR